MYDLEAAADRMREASYQGEGPNEGPKKYTFYLLDKQMGGFGVFFWYKTKKTMLKALAEDLVGFMHTPEGSDEGQAEEFVRKVSDMITSTPETLHFSEGMRKKINALMTDPWCISYIGTYENVLTGMNEWERQLRAAFREKQADPEDGGKMSKTKYEAPIGRHERRAFDEFATHPFD
jgi:hypothetical protein